MKRVTKRIASLGAVAIFFAVGSANVFGDLIASVKFDVWISPNSFVPPETSSNTPDHDCMTINFYGDPNPRTDVLLESREFPGSMLGIGSRSADWFHATICDSASVCDKQIAGWFINAVATPWADRGVIGGVIGSPPAEGEEPSENASWGFHGVVNPECQFTSNQ